MSDYAINARLLSPEQVAISFVPPPFFGRVASANHVVLLGPRGSGKTTLLSMLTQPAQRTWADLGSTPLLAPVPYIGVLVRADLTWSRQLRSFAMRLHPDDRARVVIAAYTNQCLLSATRYIRDHVRAKVEGSSDFESPRILRAELERVIVEAVAAPCGIPSDTPNLSSLKNVLNERSEMIWAGARRAAVERTGAADAPFEVDLFAAITAFAEALEDAEIGSSIGLLLDELELVPREVRNYLRTGLRDVDNRVLLKMSMSPVEETVKSFLGQLEASVGDDFLVIDLTYAQKTEGYSFTSDLLVSLARRNGQKALDAEEILGSSRFDLAANDPNRRGRYRPKGNLVDAFRTLEASDPSFAAYLDKANIDLSRVEDLAEFARAAHIRKVRDIVLLRARYLVGSDISGIVGRQRRGAKSLDFYAGRDSVMALLEGNPRWVVNFAATAFRRASSQTRLPTARQAQALADLLASVRTRVQTSPVPVDATVDVDPERGQEVLKLLDQVGAFFRSGVLGPEFDPEPPLTFIVDRSVSEVMASYVADAVSHGALIHIPDRSSLKTVRQARGERFRLAYLLGAQFQLPPILGRPVNLSTIVNAPIRELEAVMTGTELRLFEED